MKDEIAGLIKQILPELKELRHSIHRHPELAGEEVRTSALVREQLAETRVKLLPPFLQTDVVGILQGGGEGPNVTLRADMDALPLMELSGVPYASEVPGRMHACGHDGHTVILLGAAKVLNQLTDRFNGSVRFVFQPGEEVVAMGKALVEAGALENPTPKAVFALHGSAPLPVGAVSTRPGAVMAATGFFKIVIIGCGGHGSAPQVTIDPIVVGSQLVCSLQSVVARQVDPRDSVVISVCRFSAGNNGNVIPEQAELEGTFRLLNPALQGRLIELMERQVKGICEAYGATYRFEYNLPYEVCENDPACFELVRETTMECLGPEQFLLQEKSSMGGEDFCYYLQRVPGAFFNLGVGEDHVSIHNPKFDFSDNAIAAGVMMLVQLALKTLKG